MSAAIFGANLLQEVEEESLDQVRLAKTSANIARIHSAPLADISYAQFLPPPPECELLSDLRHGIEPQPRSLSGVPGIDTLLEIIHDPDRSTQNVQSEHRDQHLPGFGRSDIPFEVNIRGHMAYDNPRNRRQKPPIIEISNSASGTGKSNLLYHITAASILPKNIGGKEASIVWLDTDISFSATRVHDVCLNFLKTSTTLGQPTEQTAIVDEALKHVHVFSISSSRQLISVLDSLEDYLLQPLKKRSTHPAHFSSHRPLSLIILDSATAFYWIDRFDAEIVRLEAIKTPGTAVLADPTQIPAITTASHILTKIQALQAKFECACIYTTTQPHKSKHRSAHTRRSVGDHSTQPVRPLPDESPSLSPWTLAATLSLVMVRVPVPQFASHMSLDECLRDRSKRQEVVARNRIRVGVNEEWLGVVVRDQEVKNRLSRLEGRGAFVLRIDEGGVLVE